MVEAIGWFSSVVLLLTIGKQVHKQWREGASRGVSKWLFTGQATASAGFLWYSWLVHNWVFVVTNALMLASAAVGLGIVLHHRRRERLRPQRDDDRDANESQAPLHVHGVSRIT